MIVPTEVLLVRDYIASLSETDRIYKKLHKVSWKDAVKLQAKWHASLALSEQKTPKGDPSGELILECKDGYKWVRISTPEQLDYEGNAMGHCVGSGGYDETVDHIYSLRDSNNLPHATVEFNPKLNRYEQIQGRGNKLVSTKYWFAIKALFDYLPGYDGLHAYRKRNSCISVGDTIHIGKDIYPILSHSDVVITDMNIPKEASYGLTVEGKIYWLCGNEQIPDGTVFKHVFLRNNESILEWKWDVMGGFLAVESSLSMIAAHVKFHGNVKILNCHIKRWYHDVPGDFCIFNCPLTEVDEQTKFGGGVHLSQTNVKHWNTNVPGYFDVKKTPLESISSQTVFGRSVSIRRANITHWVNNVPGNFYISDCPLVSIDAGCIFGGDVEVRITNITHWEHDVPKDFLFYGNSLVSIAKHVKFGGSVSLCETSVKCWEHDVPGDLSIRGKALRKIASGVKVGGEMIVRLPSIKNKYSYKAIKKRVKYKLKRLYERRQEEELHRPDEEEDTFPEKVIGYIPNYEDIDYSDWD